MDITLDFKSKRVQGTVTLPASKSISNRVLIVNALADSELPIENLADCDDTQSMVRILCSENSYFDVGHAGKAMRFLTAYLSRIIGKRVLTGSERMKQRPIRVLVEALNRLGARIGYLENEGFPPLEIYGSRLVGGSIDIPASVSSQYISALLMIAPYMEKGLEIRLTGKVVSSSYIDMTLQIMREFGAEVGREDTVIGVKPGEYRSVPYRVESDWSAASYFYELLAIAGEGEIILTGLKEKSMQGDSRQTVVWRKLGVRTCYEGDLVRLSAAKPEIDRLDYDFVEMPDLVQSFAVACCMRRIPFLFRGVETLRIKETDRIQALIEELGKLGYLLKAEGDGALIWEGERTGGQPCPRIATYHDHRMAMAFAPAALKHPGLVIVDKEVVSKSFPRYWEALAGCFGTKSGYSDS